MRKTTSQIVVASSSCKENRLETAWIIRKLCRRECFLFEINNAKETERLGDFTLYYKGRNW